MPDMNVSLNLDEEVVRQVQQMATAEDRSRSNMADLLLREALAARKAAGKPNGRKSRP